MAPASSASRPVPSQDPSSTTTRMSTPGICAAPLTVAPIRSDSFLAGMTTARSPPGDMAAILVVRLTRDCPAGLAADRLRRIVGYGEYRFQDRDLQDLPYRRARGSEFKIAAVIPGLPVRGEQHVDAG